MILNFFGTAGELVVSGDAARQFLAVEDSAKMIIKDGVITTDEEWNNLVRFYTTMARLTSEGKISVGRDQFQTTLKWIDDVEKVRNFLPAVGPVLEKSILGVKQGRPIQEVNGYWAQLHQNPAMRVGSNFIDGSMAYSYFRNVGIELAFLKPTASSILPLARQWAEMMDHDDPNTRGFVSMQPRVLYRFIQVYAGQDPTR